VKLFSKNSNLQHVITIPQRHLQKDRQTEGRVDGQTDDLPWQYRAVRSIVL